jgi:SAM-dependent methyltransferase
MNRVLGHWNYTIKYKTSPAEAPLLPAEFLEQLQIVKERPGDFAVIEEFRDDSQTQHPARYVDFECVFASEQILKHQPAAILDVGSYRLWLIGLMSHWNVTTVDVRARESVLSKETIINQDVLDLNLPPDSFDMVISLSTIEHFGLGRYGDRFDLDADQKAIQRMLRVLKPGGYFVFSVPITRGTPFIAFNSHRVYSVDMIRAWEPSLIYREERFVKKLALGFIDEQQVASEIGDWDVYCACYQKAKAPS